MSAMRKALRAKHRGQPVKRGSMAWFDLREAHARDRATVTTSCALCDRVIHRGPAYWGRLAAVRHRCREHPRRRGKR